MDCPTTELTDFERFQLPGDKEVFAASLTGGAGRLGESERKKWTELDQCLRKAARDARGVKKKVPYCP